MFRSIRKGYTFVVRDIPGEVWIEGKVSNGPVFKTGLFLIFLTERNDGHAPSELRAARVRTVGNELSPGLVAGNEIKVSANDCSFLHFFNSIYSIQGV